MLTVGTIKSTRFYNYINDFFTGSHRTVTAKKHIIYSLLLKGISIIIGFLFVPLILNYLDAERYGIWLTLSSIVGWVSFFDIGLGNGLRNRLAEAIAKEDFELGKTFVSTAYTIMGLVFFIVLIIFFAVNPLINWQKILNTSLIPENELVLLTTLVFVFFILRFYFNLIGSILLADQKPAVTNSFGPISNFISLIIIYILTKTTQGSLLNLAVVLSGIPVLILISASLLFFKKSYRKFIPSIKYVDFGKSKDLLGLGVKFFIFQIASIITYSATNFLIAQFANQETVAQYNVAYKYFFMANMILGIVLSPFWSAVTDAYYKEDFNWLKRSMKKLNKLSFLLGGVLIFMLAISNFVFEFWVGNKIQIPFILSVFIVIYLIIQVFVAPFSSFINGIGKLKLQIYIISLQLIMYIPSALLLGKYMGAIGIIIGMIGVQIISLFFESRQVYLLINQKATGIWNQ